VAGESGSTEKDVNALEDDTVILDVAGTADKGGAPSILSKGS